jgi:hypothetical protein
MLSIGDIERLLSPALLAVFRADSGYSSKLVPVANKFTEWFRSSGTPFFKFYTDHSETHSIDVFRTALEFIAPEAQQSVSPQDLAILLAVSFCHDSGMHLTESQFQQLIARNNSAILCDLDSLSWPALWEIFLDEAKRFNQPTLVSIFGDAKPIEPLPEHPQDFTDRHRMLVGEFIRRHHPRLAHDLALGMNNALSLPGLLESFSAAERDIVGIISRSHGMELRDCFDYVEKRFHLRDFNRIHIVYLMILLRVSDYMQLQASRAPRIKNYIHNIVSPISSREWRVHQSITNITRTHDDPEAILIEAGPSSVGDFLRVKLWLADIQHELDKSWAVLGELYGRHGDTGLDNLTLTIRRVRSSILDGSRRFDFLAEEVRFRVAEAEMLLLLLGPLYGDHPGYGLRELLQNAHDAVREAIYLKADHLATDTPEVNLKINFKDDTNFVEIRDNGTGMTGRVIIDYFLNAGASFRSSGEWKKNFVDADGKAEIVRSGRFGVGVLAAFLVGGNISVSTRHYLEDENDGLIFHAALDQREIEIRRCALPVGTSIRIDAPKSHISALSDWADAATKLFRFDDAIKFNLEYVSDSSGRAVNLNVRDNEFLYEFSTNNYRKVRVRIAEKFTGHLARDPDYVNGIAICEYESYMKRSHGGDRPWTAPSSSYKRGFSFQVPNEFAAPYYFGDLFDSEPISIDITDNDGICSIDLSRTRFTKTDESLSNKIDSLAFQDTFAFLKSMFCKSDNEDVVWSRRERCIYRPTRSAFVYTSEGICPAEAGILNSVGLKRISCVNADFKAINVIKKMNFGAIMIGRGHDIRSVTALISRMRSYKSALSRTDLISISVIFRTDLAHEAARTTSAPRWLSQALDASEPVDEKHSFLIFGTSQAGEKNNLTKIMKAAKSEFVESFLTTSWSSRYINEYVPDRGRVQRGAFAEIWETEVGGILPWPVGVSFSSLDKRFG